MAEKPKRGRPTKLGEAQVFALRLPVDLHKGLKMLSVVTGKSMNDLVVEVLRDWWAEQPQRRELARLTKPTGRQRQG